MRILLASKHGPHGARPIGGVQSWVATIASVLDGMGHHVVLFEYGQREPNCEFDIGIFANWFYTGQLAERCDRSLHVCHGIIDAERPVHGNVAFTSEGVRDHWKVDGPIIRQPIDLSFWTPGEHKRRPLVRFGYYNGLTFLSEVADGLGYEFRHVRDEGPSGARSALRRARCVLATGRAALEAMACGAPVVICDHRSAYQGPLMDLDIDHAMRRNYSGRGGITPTPENVEKAVVHAIAAGSMRFHVEQHHDAQMIAGQLLDAA